MKMNDVLDWRDDQLIVDTDDVDTIKEKLAVGGIIETVNYRVHPQYYTSKVDGIKRINSGKKVFQFIDDTNSDLMAKLIL